MSDCGQYGFSIIAFIGSVFSPYYYWKNRRDPLDHCAINIGLYGPKCSRWTMTERGRRDVQVEQYRFQVGPSQFAWNGTKLTIDLVEIAVPWPRPVRGQIRLAPLFLNAHAVALTTNAAHRWWPMAPLADVEAEFDEPGLSWKGHGYFDTNSGDAPLESDFSTWDWSRSAHQGRSRILYDLRERSGRNLSFGLAFDAKGDVSEFEPPGKKRLKNAFWGVKRATRSDEQASVSQTLEDSPFYARSVIQSVLEGETVTSVHETLDLDRFSKPWLKFMLPFRMPRRAR